MTGIELIAAERKRQIEKEGWTADHDRQHVFGELALAAVCYAAPRKIYVREEDSDQTVYRDPWPKTWSWGNDKRGQHDRITALVKAGALIAAEIDRLQAEAVTTDEN